MIHSSTAILRCSIPEYPSLEAGNLVLISDLAFESGSQERRFPAALHRPESPLLWFRSTCLLPLSKFLQIQPRSEFWQLVSKQPSPERKTSDFLQDPVKQVWGPKGFRFESVGEVVHYVRLYQLDSHTFKLCHVYDFD